MVSGGKEMLDDGSSNMPGVNCFNRSLQNWKHLRNFVPRLGGSLLSFPFLSLLISNFLFSSSLYLFSVIQGRRARVCRVSGDTLILYTLELVERGRNDWGILAVTSGVEIHTYIVLLGCSVNLGEERGKKEEKYLPPGGRLVGVENQRKDIYQWIMDLPK